jgi:hypothetical protein
MISYGFENSHRHNLPKSTPTASETALEPCACQKRAIDWWVVGTLLALALCGLAQGFGFGMLLS